MVTQERTAEEEDQLGDGRKKQEGRAVAQSRGRGRTSPHPDGVPGSGDTQGLAQGTEPMATGRGRC